MRSVQSLEGDDTELKYKKKVNRRVHTCQVVTEINVANLGGPCNRIH